MAASTVTGKVIYIKTMKANQYYKKPALAVRMDIGYVPLGDRNVKVIAEFKVRDEALMKKLTEIKEIADAEGKLIRLRFRNVKLTPATDDEGQPIFGANGSLNMDISRKNLYRPIGVKQLKSLDTSIEFEAL